MTNADLKLIDSNPRDAFDFSLDHHKEQIVAGYSRTTPAWGLEVFMPDYYQLQKAKAPPQNAKAETRPGGGAVPGAAGHRVNRLTRRGAPSTPCSSANPRSSGGFFFLSSSKFM